MSWVKQVQPDINGTYKMNTKVYQDGSTKMKIYKPNYFIDDPVMNLEYDSYIDLCPNLELYIAPCTSVVKEKLMERMDWMEDEELDELRAIFAEMRADDRADAIDLVLA